MKCPKCDYEPKLAFPDDDWDNSVENPFFTISNNIIATRQPYHWDSDRVEERPVLGCPECMNIFMGDS